VRRAAGRRRRSYAVHYVGISQLTNEDIPLAVLQILARLAGKVDRSSAESPRLGPAEIG
jgi:hypothetical protein